MSEVNERWDTTAGRSLRRELLGGEPAGWASQDGRLDLRGMDAANQSLRGRRLPLARLDGSNLRGADLRDTDLSHASLSHADLTGSRLDGSTLQFAHGEYANLRGSTLINADLRNACLAMPVFERASLRRANLAGAILASADFRHADLREMRLDGADLDGSIFFGARTNKAPTGGNVEHATRLGAPSFRTALGLYMLAKSGLPAAVVAVHAAVESSPEPRGEVESLLREGGWRCGVVGALGALFCDVDFQLVATLASSFVGSQAVLVLYLRGQSEVLNRLRSRQDLDSSTRNAISWALSGANTLQEPMWVSMVSKAVKELRDGVHVADIICWDARRRGAGRAGQHVAALDLALRRSSVDPGR